jgi:DNA-directed RNA polymerase subunit RPC12/RpoP
MTYRCSDCGAEFEKPYVQEHTDLIAYGSCISSEVTCVTNHCPECGCEDFTELEE